MPYGFIDFLARDWLGHALADDWWMFERPRPRIPRSLMPTPRHSSASLGRRYWKPVIRSWLGVGNPTLTHTHPGFPRTPTPVRTPTP